MLVEGWVECVSWELVEIIVLVFVVVVFGGFFGNGLEVGVVGNVGM